MRGAIFGSVKTEGASSITPKFVVSDSSPHEETFATSSYTAILGRKDMPERKCT